MKVCTWLALSALSTPLPVYAVEESAALIDEARRELNQSLRFAAREGRIGVMDRIINQGAAVDGPGEYGETALMYAARFNQISAARFLITHGASPNSQDSMDSTPLIKAGMNCSHRVSALMLEGAKAQVNLVDRDGKTALIHASETGCLPMVRQLLKVPGIEVNIQDDSQHTALDYSMEEAQMEVGGRYSEISHALLRRGGKTVYFTTIRGYKPQNPPLSDIDVSKKTPSMTLH